MNINQKEILKKQDLTWTPFKSLLWREIRRYFKVIVQTVLTPLVNASLYLLIFGVSLGHYIDVGNDLPYIAFVIPGLMMMACLNNSFQNTSSTIVSSKFSGDLEDYRVAPLNPFQILMAMALAAVSRGLLVGWITFFVSEVFYRLQIGTWLPVSNYPVLFFFLFFGALLFSFMGLAVAFWAKSFDQMSAVGAFVLTPLIFLGGVFFSLEQLSPFWQKVALYNPLLYLINGVRYGVLGHSDVPVLQSMIITIVSLVVLFFVAYTVVSKAKYKRW